MPRSGAEPRTSAILISRSPEETHDLGFQIAQDLRVPGVVLLRGALGTGKTTLARGIACGLGLEDPTAVSSPSFTLVNTYQGRCPIYHVDLYRVQSERDLETVGIDEFLGERGITIVEWGERITFPLRNDIVVELEDAGGETRRLRIHQGKTERKENFPACVQRQREFQEPEAEKMKRPLSGIFPPITTPFDSEGGLQLDQFKANLERWAEFGLGGLTVLGSNGESPFLSDEEKLLLVRESRPLIGRNKAMIVGAGRESTRACMQFIRKIADLGADYALVGTPCYFKSAMTDDVLFGHFGRIADSSPIPVLIYNVPQFTGINTSAGLVERLSRHERIAGIKESSGNLVLQGDIRRRTPGRLHSSRRIRGHSASQLDSRSERWGGGDWMPPSRTDGRSLRRLRFGRLEKGR